MQIRALLTTEFSLKSWQVDNTLELFGEGATIPFVARYRKERTGELDETVLRNLKDRFDYLTELEERRATVLASIREQGKLTPELEKKIMECVSKTVLEDLYLPYKPKRRTRATIARERGLEPLADVIRAANAEGTAIDMEVVAASFVDAAKEVPDVKTALAGASDILAEEIAEDADVRQTIRNVIIRTGSFVSRLRSDAPEGPTKFDMYKEYTAPVMSIPAHAMLAMRRGEADNVLSLSVDVDEDAVLDYVKTRTIKSSHPALVTFLTAMVRDAWMRLMKISLFADVRLDKKKRADEESISTFGINLRELLLASPAGMQPTLGIDPGFRTGCKVAVVDATSRFIEYKTLFPTAGSEQQRQQAAATIVDMIQRHGIKLIAIGNGTAGRETEDFVRTTLEAALPPGGTPPLAVMVSEAGASVYSASEVAKSEFPELDLTIRGAISIARRLQDPLAELVKIDPKSIGVGQYQHDVDQRLLKSKLEETVESCVNFVGVDLNLASAELLSFVSGLTPSLAKGIVEYRNANGPFLTRQQLLKVPRFGAKAFEQSAGFLRIRQGENPLDNSGVHPERYHLVETIAGDIGVSVTEITRVPEKIRAVNIKKYVSETVGEPTIRDVLAELEKPGRDPRAEFKYASFKDGVRELKDLNVGMELEGVVTNVANFGAFVDIGVHQDGLVHVSQLANRFIKDPNEVVKVGQVVKVTVLEVNVPLKRISLTMKSAANAPQRQRKEEPKWTADDLKSRFGK